MIHKEKQIFFTLFFLISAVVFATTPGDNPFRKVAKDVTPVVVQINTIYTQKVKTGGSPFDFFFNNGNSNSQPQYREYKSQGLGSGIVVEVKGDKKYILTNNHVIKDATELKVHFNSGKEYNAELVGADSRKDLALLLIETKDIIPKAKLGDSDDLYIGDWAIAIGSPLGYESTVSLGIISAIGRKPDPRGMTADFTDYIQTDAAINKGNSGGALVNIDGEIIGINTWIASEDGGNIGLGFSIPINNAKDVIKQLITKGKVEYGWLGVSMGGIPKDISAEIKENRTSGAFIYSLFKNSPADKGGLKPGDIVIGINGKDITNQNELLHNVGVLPAGKKATFKIIRNNKEISLNIYPELRNDTNKRPILWPGITTIPLTTEIIDGLNKYSDTKIKKSTKGVVVYSVAADSVSKLTGIVQGDIITQVDNIKIKSSLDFYQAIASSGSEVTVRVIRKGQNIKLILLNE